MAITRTPIIDDDGTGTTGTVIDNAWKTELYNQIDASFAQPWAAVPFSAGNFWPGVTAAMVATNVYSVIGNTLFWMVQLNNAPAPTPANAALPFVLPVGRAIFPQAAVGAPAFASDGPIVPAIILPLSSVIIGVYKSAGGTWAGPVTVYFSVVIGLA
jgi:hypothetical protein